MLTINLSNKIVVITGSSQGIGKAMSDVFAKSGAEVVLTSRNKDKLEENIRKIKEKGLKARSFVLDVSVPQDVEKVFKDIGHVDILINNAGVYFTSSVSEMNVSEWKNLLEINLNGAMYCTKAVIEKMKSNKYGRIINISSVSGKVGEAYSSAYNASKFGLIGFTQAVALELASCNITVNAVCPGWVETKMAEDILHDKKYASLHGVEPEKLKELSLAAVPINRYIYPSEVAYLALYLASDYANAITGQAINICGGMCMH